MKKTYEHDNPFIGYPDAGTLTLPEFPGYTARVSYHEAPEDPREAFDCEPPLATYSDSWEGPGIAELWEEVPEKIKREKWKAFARILLESKWLGVDWSYERRNYPETSPQDTLEDIAASAETPGRGLWGSVEDYCDTMAAICDVAGIPYRQEVSRGYCQGDVARLFVFAPPSWVAEVGAPEESIPSQLEGACELWAAWAWGDVYGVAEIVREDGTEVPESSCWGFYGQDFEWSGLVEFVRETIEADKAECKQESRRAHEAACRDIETVTG